MAEETGIEFCSGTANTHLGCARIGAGCGCRHLRKDWGDPVLNKTFKKYGGKCWAQDIAETQYKFNGVDNPAVFGVGLQRHEFDRESVLARLLKIDNFLRQGDTQWINRPTPTGTYICFAVSMGDFFDHETPQWWRDWWWNVIRITPHIRWLPISKRASNVITLNMLPEGWPYGYEHVTVLITVAIQAELEPAVNNLVSFPAMCRGLILEPMLQMIDISHALKYDLDWLIVGGESGSRYDDDPEIAKTQSPEGMAAPFDLEWARQLKRRWVGAGRSYFFKQGGCLPFDRGVPIKLRYHGGELEDLPPELRHRTWPGQMIEPLAELHRRAFKAGILVP